VLLCVGDPLSQLYGCGATSLPASKKRPLLPACNLSLPFLPTHLLIPCARTTHLFVSPPLADQQATSLLTSRRKLLPFRLYPLRRATLPVPAAPYILPTQAAGRFQRFAFTVNRFNGLKFGILTQFPEAQAHHLEKP
jgi:hypothetical protein